MDRLYATPDVDPRGSQLGNNLSRSEGISENKTQDLCGFVPGQSLPEAVVVQAVGGSSPLAHPLRKTRESACLV
jgi:hypothetical protein